MNDRCCQKVESFQTFVVSASKMQAIQTRLSLAVFYFVLHSFIILYQHYTTCLRLLRAFGKLLNTCKARVIHSCNSRLHFILITSLKIHLHLVPGLGAVCETDLKRLHRYSRLQPSKSRFQYLVQPRELSRLQNRKKTDS